MATQIVRNQEEASVLNAHFLHCGSVEPGAEWDTVEAWADPDTRRLARTLLARYRRNGELPSEDERKALATCCA